jgi:hypothetical protein
VRLHQIELHYCPPIFREYGPRLFRHEPLKCLLLCINAPIEPEQDNTELADSTNWCEFLVFGDEHGKDERT